MNAPRARLLVWIFCALAALRVFIFAAAFPFFNNLDEQAHLDLVLKYSHAHLPRGLENFSPDTIDLIVRYGSAEFFLPPEAAAAALQDRQQWNGAINAEAWQPPLYYAAAGAWTKIGATFGVSGARLLYWARFLNVILIGVLVWLCFIAAREFFPKQIWAQLSAPLLIAFMPQDMFYGIENDVLSPICFGALFICTAHWWQSERPPFSTALLLGLSFAATYLTKLTNAPLLFIVISILALKFFSLMRSQNLRRALSAHATLIVAAIVPIIAWMIWMRIFFGDLTGSAAHIELSGWTPKPFSDWLAHPIFTFAGARHFFFELIASFWRGEFIWHGTRLASRPLDLCYGFFTIVFIAVAIADLPRRFREKTSGGMFFFALSILFAAVAFLILISVRFDFGNDVYPSRAQPYLPSGRLISGALIPFSILFVAGLERSLRWSNKKWLPFLFISILAVAMTASEIALSRSVFASACNWFHLP